MGDFVQEFIDGAKQASIDKFFSFELNPQKIILLAIIVFYFLGYIFKKIDRTSADAEKKRKERGRHCKAFGGILLLLSYTSQNFIYERWDTKLKKEQDHVNSSNLNFTHSLLYLNAYLSSANNPERFAFPGDSLKHTIDSTGKLKDSMFMIFSSRKLVLSFFSDIQSGDTTFAAKNEVFKRLMKLADSSHNLTNYFSLFSTLVSVQATIVQVDRENMQQILIKKELASELYLGAYIIGSLVLLLGLYFD